MFLNTTKMPLCVVCGNFTEKVVTLPRRLQIQNVILYDTSAVDPSGFEVVIHDLTNVPLVASEKNSILCTDIGNNIYKDSFYTQGKRVIRVKITVKLYNNKGSQQFSQVLGGKIAK